MKPCSTCRIEQPLKQFHRHSRSKDGLKGQCKSCVAARTKIYVAGLTEPRRPNRSPESISRRRRYHTTYQLNYNKTPKGKLAHYKFLIKKKYGITWDQYQSLLTSQNGLCAICNKGESPKRRLAIDHCHKTNRVRGLLCIKCNRALGYLCDDPAIVRSALEYLLKK